MFWLIRIALRNVSRQRRRSLITLSAVFLAVFVMVAIRGFLNGLQSSLRETVVLGQTGSLQVHRVGFLKSIGKAPLDLDLPADAAFLARIRAVPGVTAAAARISFGGMVNVGDTTAFALFTAIEPGDEARVCPRMLELVSSGKPLASGDDDAVLLAPALAAHLGIGLGGTATLLANDRDGVLNALDFRYVGAYGQPLPIGEKKIGFVPIAFAQRLLRMEGRATEIAVAVEHLDKADAIKPKLEAALGPDYEVSSWREVASFVDEAIASQDGVVKVLAGIFWFVAMLGIANTMLMAVLERTREIGTMMSLGMRRRQILGLFVLEAAFIGMLGGALGALAGGGLVSGFARSGITIRLGGMAAPLHLYPWITGTYVASMLAVAVAAAAAAALWPSLRASRLRPVEALASV